MTRDFLIEFEIESLALVAETQLKNITIDKKENLFGIIENRGKSLFITLTYPYEITDSNNVYLNNNIIHKGLRRLNFCSN